MCRSSGFTSLWTNSWICEGSLGGNETLTALLLTWRTKKIKASWWRTDLPCVMQRVLTLSRVFRFWVLWWTNWSTFHTCRSFCSSINPLRDFRPLGCAPVRLKVVLVTDGRRRDCGEYSSSYSPGKPPKKSNLHALILLSQQCSHICAPAEKPY